VPADALYGVQTLRAPTELPDQRAATAGAVIIAQVWIKKAAALTHRETGRLDPKLADRESGRPRTRCWPDSTWTEFIVDPYQAGAGTSHNMNANEVLANRANELLGHERGTYSPVHPNDHVNMAQSTNDTIPTNIRLATLSQLVRSRARSRSCARSRRRARVRRHRQGRRTHLQDAMPIRLGQEFTAYAGSIDRGMRA
jgi:aspartate ammonia-lyase